MIEQTFDASPTVEVPADADLFHRDLATAMTDAHIAVEAAFAAIDELDGKAVLDAVGQVETLRRRVDALGVALTDRVDREGLFRIDGHRSPTTTVAHRAKTSRAEGRRRRNVARTTREMPAVAKWFAAGEIGSGHMDRLAQAHANERVRDALVECDELIADAARSMDHREFDLFIGDFVRLVDQDGTCDRNEANHRGRNATLTQRHDLGWDLTATFSALQGARVDETFQAFLYAELCADWDAARAEKGAAACEDDLPRTVGQRRNDALACIFDLAAISKESPQGCPTETTIVFDPDAWERALAWLESGETEPVDPTQAAEAAATGRATCRTGNGVRLEPREATAQSLVGTIRRVVVDAKGVPVDRSRPVRLFAGTLRAAIMTVMTGCTWPGCGRPVGSCQIDHVHPHGRGGETSGDNAGLLCGHHNRLKNHGFRTWKDPTGTWHTYRPDGTEIPN